MKEFAEFYYFCNEQRRDWKVNWDVGNKKAAILGGGPMIVPCIPHVLAENDKMNTVIKDTTE